MDCYYEPYSKCTFQDALRNDAGQMLTLETLPTIRLTDDGRNNASGKEMSYEEEAFAATEGKHENEKKRKKIKKNEGFFLRKA